MNAIRRNAQSIFDTLKSRKQEEVQREIGRAMGLSDALDIINECARLQASEQSRRED